MPALPVVRSHGWRESAIPPPLSTLTAQRLLKTDTVAIADVVCSGDLGPRTALLKE